MSLPCLPSGSWFIAITSLREKAVREEEEVGVREEVWEEIIEVKSKGGRDEGEGEERREKEKREGSRGEEGGEELREVGGELTDVLLVL